MVAMGLSLLGTVRPLLTSKIVGQFAAAGRHLHKTSNTIDLKAMATAGPVELSIKGKIEASLNPKHLQIINESYMHNVPPGSETHFKVVVVSDAFSDLALIKRHRLVNTTLSEELESGVHALSIVAKTPAQWSEGSKEVEKSPACRGGFGK